MEFEKSETTGFTSPQILNFVISRTPAIPPSLSGLKSCLTL